ncbi:MAG TPA: hypothetical protein VNV85_14330 [Puia sp.]|jgi:hypothetical protein|nr:hypothetical protein [Puia sp.]
MENEIILVLSNGNCKTTFAEDTNNSKFFWDNFFSESIQDDNYNFFSETKIDLMGNPIKTENLYKNTA